MPTPSPQRYYRSTEPDVVTSFRTMAAALQTAQDNAFAFVKEVATLETRIFGGYVRGRFELVGIDFDTPPPRWKAGRQGYSPYKNNPLHQRFVELTVQLPTVLGSPSMVMQEYQVVSPARFIHDDTLYADYQIPVTLNTEHGEGVGWEPIPASTYHLAKESLQGS